MHSDKYSFRDLRNNFRQSEFLYCFIILWIVTLAVPTIEVYKLNHSLGRFPVYIMYVGLLTPEYWIATIPIVVAHILISYAGAALICKIRRLIWERNKGKRPEHLNRD